MSPSRSKKSFQNHRGSPYSSPMKFDHGKKGKENVGSTDTPRRYFPSKARLQVDYSDTTYNDALPHDHDGSPVPEREDRNSLTNAYLQQSYQLSSTQLFPPAVQNILELSRRLQETFSPFLRAPYRNEAVHSVTSAVGSLQIANDTTPSDSALNTPFHGASSVAESAQPGPPTSTSVASSSSIFGIPTGRQDCIRINTLGMIETDLYNRLAKERAEQTEPCPRLKVAGNFPCGRNPASFPPSAIEYFDRLIELVLTCRCPDPACEHTPHCSASSLIQMLQSSLTTLEKLSVDCRFTTHKEKTAANMDFVPFVSLHFPRLTSLELNGFQMRKDFKPFLEFLRRHGKSLEYLADWTVGLGENKHIPDHMRNFLPALKGLAASVHFCGLVLREELSGGKRRTLEDLCIHGVRPNAAGIPRSVLDLDLGRFASTLKYLSLALHSNGPRFQWPALCALIIGSLPALEEVKFVADKSVKFSKNDDPHVKLELADWVAPFSSSKLQRLYMPAQVAPLLNFNTILTTFSGKARVPLFDFVQASSPELQLIGVQDNIRETPLVVAVFNHGREELVPPNMVQIKSYKLKNRYFKLYARRPPVLEGSNTVI